MQDVRRRREVVRTGQGAQYTAVLAARIVDDEATSGSSEARQGLCGACGPPHGFVAAMRKAAV
jgi:hypothetical protein